MKILTLHWVGMAVFIFGYSYAIYLGISSIAKEKTQGTAEYLFTKPLGRNQIVIGKAAANECYLFILAAVSGVCNYYTAIAPLGGLDQKNAALLTTVGLFLTEILDWFLGIKSLQILQTGYAFGLWRFNSILLYLFCGRIFVYSGSVLFNTSKIL